MKTLLIKNVDIINFYYFCMTKLNKFSIILFIFISINWFLICNQGRENKCCEEKEQIISVDSNWKYWPKKKKNAELKKLENILFLFLFFKGWWKGKKMKKIGEWGAYGKRSKK